MLRGCKEEGDPVSASCVQGPPYRAGWVDRSLQFKVTSVYMEQSSLI